MHEAQTNKGRNVAIVGGLDEEERALEAELSRDFDQQELLDMYWHVSRCWANPELAVRENMTFERAVKTLRRVRDSSVTLFGVSKLSRMSNRLLNEIVVRQVDSPEVEAVAD